MLEKVVVMSRDQCVAAACGRPGAGIRLPGTFVLLQILGNEEGEFPCVPGALQALRLRLDDVHEDTPGLRRHAGVERWPDHGINVTIAVMPGLTETVSMPGAEHAQEIAQFCEQAHRLDVPLTLVVHCLAGKSRSLAVAVAVSQRFGISLEQHTRATSKPNPRLLRLLQQAWN